MSSSTRQVSNFHSPPLEFPQRRDIHIAHVVFGKLAPKFSDMTSLIELYCFNEIFRLIVFDKAITHAIGLCSSRRVRDGLVTGWWRVGDVLGTCWWRIGDVFVTCLRWGVVYTCNGHMNLSLIFFVFVLTSNRSSPCLRYVCVSKSWKSLSHCWC